MPGGQVVDPWARHALLRRVALALLVLVYSVVVSVGFIWRDDTLVTLLVTAGLTLPWVVSGARPTVAFALMAGTAAAQLVLDVALIPANLLILLALYRLAEVRSRRVSLTAAGLVVVGACIAAVRWNEDFSSGLVPFLATSGGAVAAWTLGNNTALRRVYAESLQRRADQLEREQAHLAQLAAAQERSRIARDLHDIISHSMAGVLTIAEATLERPDLDDDHREAMRLIGASCRGSLAELRRLLRLLHEHDEGDRDERPSVTHLPALLLPFEVRGVATRFDTSPRVERLPEVVQVALYRVAQEALTNVHKHAGDDVRTVTVSLRVGADRAELTVRDDGQGCAAHEDGSPGGFGLRGMSERLALIDGEVTVGDAASGGFVVRASVPLDQDAAEPGVGRTPPWERVDQRTVAPVPSTGRLHGPPLDTPTVADRGIR